MVLNIKCYCYNSTVLTDKFSSCSDRRILYTTLTIPPTIIFFKNIFNPTKAHKIEYLMSLLSIKKNQFFNIINFIMYLFYYAFVLLNS